LRSLAGGSGTDDRHVTARVIATSACLCSYGHGQCRFGREPSPRPSRHIRRGLSVARPRWSQGCPGAADHRSQLARPGRVESTRTNAVLAGDNSERPRLAYLGGSRRQDRRPRDHLGRGWCFPPGLAVGVVAALDSGRAASRALRGFIAAGL
jgi:hypothetical protein